MLVATASQRSTPPLLPSGVHVHSTSMSYGDGNSVQADVKPSAEFTDLAIQQWTPSKRLIFSPTKMLPRTPVGMKTEVCTYEELYNKYMSGGLSYAFAISACLLAIAWQ